MSDAAAHPSDHAPGHAGDHEPHVNYMAKFYWLVGLTTVEVLVAIFVPGGWKLVGLTALSLWKAGIVLNYFMHLKSENLALKLAMAFPVVLIVILVTLFLLDGYFLGYSSTQG